LSKDKLMISGSVAIVDEDRCAICLTCVRLCPYEVPKINENNRAYIDAASCQGCGVCAVACPARAIEIRHYKDEQILAKCEAIDIRKELDYAGRK
jgi:heterodisulfide reductase subunit A-like polyferredoxin